MLAGLNSFGTLADVKDVWNNWDMVSYLIFPEKPGVGTQADFHLMLMSPVSKSGVRPAAAQRRNARLGFARVGNTEAAFKVMTTVVSDEVQLVMVRMAKGSVLKDNKFQDEFGKGLGVLKDINLKAAFMTKPASAFPPTEICKRCILRSIQTELPSGIFSWPNRLWHAIHPKLRLCIIPLNRSR